MAHRALGDLDRAEADLRRAAELQPDVGGVHRALSGVLAARGALDEAVRVARLAARLDPDDLDTLSGLAGLLFQAGRQPEAERAFQRCLALDPHDTTAHLYLGLFALQGGSPRRAASHLAVAVTGAPEVLPAWLSLARALRELARFDEAVETVNQATVHHPDEADLPAEEGQIRLRAGEPDRAEAALRRALELEPTHLHAAHALGTLLRSQGRAGEALAAHRAAIASRPEHTWAWIGFADAVAACTAYADDLAEDLLAALGREGVDHQLLDRAVRACLEALPGVADAVAGAPLSPTARATLAAHPLTGPWLERCIACHPGWEALLADLRDTLLREDPGAPLLGPLAVQSWHTEHAWRPAPPGSPWPPPRDEEPGAEEEIQVIALTDDPVSLEVRAQYEANPYPRLVSLHRKPAEPLHQLLAGLFPHFADAPRPEGPLRILVAGCGTGQQALAAATRYQGAEVLAVDLSRASCAATQRRARAWGLTNLRVAQADILALGDLDERFHLVEAGGVLHHLAHPMRGWRVLAELTEPGGLMKIGLYSISGREGVYAAQRLLQEAGTTTDAEGLRAARQRILSLPEGHPAREVVWSPDFYSLSGFRDLVLHVCEHAYSLGGIGGALDQLGLDLVGFQHGRPEPNRWYAERFPEDAARTDLTRWAQVEAAHPRAFAGMYQFWCHKPPAR